MTKQELCKIIGKIDDKYVEEAAENDMAAELQSVQQETTDFENGAVPKEEKPKPAAKHWKRMLAAAACLAVICGALLWNSGRKEGDKLKLDRSSSEIRARIISELPETGIASTGDMAWLTEEEIFEKWDTAIFQGTILSIQNIAVEYDGWAEYLAVAEILVNEVFRGKCEAGSTISVLLPGPVDLEGLWMEDTGVISQMRTGMAGIFMPMQYDENSVKVYYGTGGKENARLYLMDLAEYGFPDGERFAFLETENGLVYAEYAYKSLEGVQSLSEIGEYIQRMLR